MTELIGSREHGIKRLEDFTSEKARQEAKSRCMADGQGVPGYRGEPSSLHQPCSPATWGTWTLTPSSPDHKT
uniref:Uncharacterized protein n=1 Tax=Setaria viridis TaxID=4556 RepID=A0A4U6TYN3_SETVI|nr:hypothetical protein SEVIR_7G311300v2 [Setaria viridis]